MTEEKPENYDLKLYERLKNFCRDNDIVIVTPKHNSPKSIPSTVDIISIQRVVDTQQSLTLQISKKRKMSGIDTGYYYQPYSIPLTPPDKPLDSIIVSVGNSKPSIHQQIFEQSKMTPKDLSTKLGFDTEAMVKPKTKADVVAVLDEAISLMETLNKNFDDFVGYHSREDFRAGDHSFSQVMDEDDNAHIYWMDPEIKKNILDNNLVGVSPWVEIFKIDGNYCNFTNKHGKVVGRIHTVSARAFTPSWVFESERIDGTTWDHICRKPYPYDCEREVIQWMVGLNLLEDFMNHNPE